MAILKKYSSIENVKGSANNDTLIGGTKAGLIVGGAGDNQIWGGSVASQTMTGGTGADTFWFATGDGNDVVTDYKASESDTVRLSTATYSGVLAGVNITTANNATTAANTDIKIAMGSESVTLANAAVTTTATDGITVNVADKDNKTVKLVVAANAAGSGVTYSADTKLYYSSSANSVLKVTGSDDTSLYLGNGWNGTNGSSVYFSANNITKIDASTATNANYVFAGYGAVNNTIVGAGAGSTTAMWGGGNSADVLIGGAGVDSFYFGTGDGKDVISNATSADKVVIYKDDIASLKGAISGTSLVITTTAGDTLTIQNWFGTDVMNTFQVGTGATNEYSFNRTSGNFEKKSS